MRRRIKAKNVKHTRFECGEMLRPVTAGCALCCGSGGVSRKVLLQIQIKQTTHALSCFILKHESGVISHKIIIISMQTIKAAGNKKAFRSFLATKRIIRR